MAEAVAWKGWRGRQSTFLTLAMTLYLLRPRYVRRSLAEQAFHQGTSDQKKHDRGRSGRKRGFVTDGFGSNPPAVGHVYGLSTLPVARASIQAHVVPLVHCIASLVNPSCGKRRRTAPLCQSQGQPDRDPTGASHFAGSTGVVGRAGEAGPPPAGGSRP